MKEEIFIVENKLQVFQNEEFGELEILTIDDKPYFPATECAKVLGYANTKDAIIRHCRWVVKHDLPHPQNPKKTIAVNFIPEGDLYRLIIRSKLPAAEKFERWVFDEVLPSIRKRGGYITGEELDKILRSSEYAAFFIQELQKERDKNEVMLDHICEIMPKVQYCDSILQVKNGVPITLIAKDYGMSATLFNKLLNTLKVQYRVAGTWILYSAYANNGYTASYTHHINQDKAVIHTYWTQKGRLFIYELLKERGVTPVCERSDGDG
jgi:prophage antirepressor-like protein